MTTIPETGRLHTPKKKMIAAEARTLTGQCGIDDQLMIRDGVIVELRI